MLDIERELELLRGEVARLRMIVDANHREVMEALGTDAPGRSRSEPLPPPWRPPRGETPDAVSRNAARWARAVIARDGVEVAEIERLMRGAGPSK